MRGLIARVRSLWRGIRRAADVESEMAEEFRLHIELRTEDLVASGLSPAEAARQARLAFGGVARYREEGRGSRGLHYFDEVRFSWLDVRLGARMLIKHPGLALVGGLAMAVAIAIGATFDVIAGSFEAPLPFEEGERIVALENIDTKWNDQERRILHDFAVWRDELTSVVDLGAFRLVERNLLLADRPPELVAVAGITASGFAMARVPPLLGRPLVAADERADASPAVVIGYDAWQTHFAADSGIAGGALQLGDTTYTIVGVMPQGFGFPINHQFWVPLRENPQASRPLAGPGIHVFARLAPGVSLERAQIELSTIGQRMAAALPRTHARLSPRLMPYTRHLFDDMSGWEVTLVRGLVTLLLVVVCATVATLVYARTATRRGEIAVRTALGASRRRIIAQLFVEALVLTLGAAAVGLMVARYALGHISDAVAQFLDTPFWMDFSISLRTVAYTLGLAVLAAVVVGVVPALSATGRGMQAQLRALGGTGLRFGKTWTTMIVIQVAFAVAFLPAAMSVAGTFMQYGLRHPGYAADEFLVARLHMDRETSAGEAELRSRESELRQVASQAELVRRLAAAPGVTDVIPMEGVPGLHATVRIELDGPTFDASAGDPRVGTTRVDIDLFHALDVALLAGRGLRAEDVDSAATAVLVNRSFVEGVLHGASAVGRRIRYLEEEGHARPGRWYEIVGVVDDFPARAMEPDRTPATVYHALPPGQIWGRLAVRVMGAAPLTFAGQFRDITAALDPNILIRELIPLVEVLREEHRVMRLSALAIALVTMSVILLSAAGIFALMSFTVSQRRREIGIRAALGANPRRLLLSIFSRALVQLGTGILAGGLIALMMARAIGEDAGGWSVLAISALMMLVGVLATALPARRGLRIQPTEALRAE